MRVLVIQSLELPCDPLAKLLAVHAWDVHRAQSLDEARKIVGQCAFDALIVDVSPSADACIAFLEDLAAATRPFPHVLAIVSEEPAAIGFRLAQLGVRAILRKPIDAARLGHAWERSLGAAPDLRPLVRTSVGFVELHAAETLVRSEMIAEALARSGGSRRAAAKILGISRQSLQHIVRIGSEHALRSDDDFGQRK